MSVSIILSFMILILIIIILVCKIIFINNSIRDITKQLNKKISGTNNLITTSTNNKNINNLAVRLNEDLKKLRKKELKYDNGNQELYRSITNISHDLRTPLTAIKGYIDLLKKEKNIKREKQYIDIIDSKSTELICLTDQLFDYSRSLDLQNSLKPENICINSILEEVILSYYALFNDKKITPNIKICKNKIYKVIDKTILTRIFENIISNAIKYADKEMNITLLDNGKILFSNKTNSLDSISVKKIFDRYFTVENAKRSTGVGLSIAKQLIELNGGQIEAKYKNNNLIIEVYL